MRTPPPSLSSTLSATNRPIAQAVPTKAQRLARSAGLALLPLLACAALLTTAPAQAQAATADNQQAPLATMPSLDLGRYMGTWYEQARYPNRFQRSCSGPAVATYSLLPQGTVQVVNRCPQADGSTDEAIGEARRVGDAGSARLQVRFAPAWLSWLPFVWGNYWVVDLDADYQVSVVSEPQREYLWVLSRSPSLPPAAWAALQDKLRAMGFDLVRLQRAGGG